MQPIVFGERALSLLASFPIPTPPVEPNRAEWVLSDLIQSEAEEVRRWAAALLGRGESTVADS
jgi:hypothetical protein